MADVKKIVPNRVEDKTEELITLTFGDMAENIKLYLNESFSYCLQYVYFSYTPLDI